MSGVLFCGQFPLLCVVHALVVFSSFLSHPEDRSWLHPPPSPFLPLLVAEFVVFGAPTVALEYISMARGRGRIRSLYASRARRTDQAVQHYGSEPTPKISPHPNAVQLFRGGEIANPRTSTRQNGQISHWCHRSNPAKTVVASTSRRAIHDLISDLMSAVFDGHSREHWRETDTVASYHSSRRYRAPNARCERPPKIPASQTLQSRDLRDTSAMHFR